jgi:hypothetical protein
VAVGAAATQIARHRDTKGPRASALRAVSIGGVYGCRANYLPVKGLQIAYAGEIYTRNTSGANRGNPYGGHGGEGSEGSGRVGRQGRKRRESRVHFDDFDCFKP